MFGVCKYTFLIFEKRRMSEKIVSIFVSILFFNVWKRGKEKKIVLGFLGFVSIL